MPDPASDFSTVRSNVDDPTPRRERLRNELGLLAELVGVGGFAVTYPVLSPFGESPETFVAAGATPGQIVAFAAVLALGLPLLLWLLVLPTGFVGSSAVRRWAHTLLVGGLAATAGSVIARGVGANSGVRTVVAVTFGVAVAALRHRGSTPVQLFLRYTAPFPILLAVMFLFASPVTPLVRAPDKPRVDTSGIDSAARPPLVMIVLDELPTASLLDGRGDIAAERFPNIARVADTSTWYRNHTTSGASTLQSIPGLLTGRVDAEKAASTYPVYSSFPDNLFSLLGGTYEINAQESVTRLCPPSICSDEAGGELDDDVLALTEAVPVADPNPVRTLLDQAFSLWRAEAWPLSDGYDPGYAIGGRGNAGRQETTSETLRAVNSIGAATGTKPMFDYLHVPLPHQPWFLLPSGHTHDAPEIPFGNEFLRTWPKGTIGTETAQAGEAQMQLQLQWTDRALGVVIDRLQELDRWDDAMVVLTADHGFSFEAATSARVAYTANQRSIAWAPLFIKLPGQQEPEIVDDEVLAVDVVPTILEVLDIESPSDLEGISLLEGATPTERDRRFMLATDTDFDQMDAPKVARLDADGLAMLRTAGRPVIPGDRLDIWRHGRHGDMIGRSVDDLGECSGVGPNIAVERSNGWDDLVAGRLAPDDPRPLWHAGTVDIGESIDVVAVSDGVVAGWGVTLINVLGTSRVGVLVAEPLVTAPKGPVTFYQVVDGDDCRLEVLGGQ